jgi:L-arabinose transport system substrate-binding protein
LKRKNNIIGGGEMKKKLIWLLVVVVIVSMSMFVGIGCKTTTDAETTAAAATTAAATTAAATTAAAETTAAAAETTAAAGKSYKIGYACKILTNPWFVAELGGMEKFASEAGNLEIIALDSNLDEERLLEQVDELIGQKVDALIICLTSATLGPSITKKAEAANIPVVAIDDAFNDHYGNPVPYTGMPNFEIGKMGGMALAKLANEKGFFDEGNVAKFMGIASPKSPVQMERIEGYKAALFTSTPMTADKNFELAASESGFMDDAITVASAIINANPQVTHWIAGGVNDDTGVGALKAFEELGMSKDNYFACGVAGYDIGLEELSKGNTNYITVGAFANIEGYKCAQMVYEYLVNATPMPADTFVAGKVLDVNNYKESVFYDSWMKSKETK